MRLLIVSTAPIILNKNEWMAYGPYAKEMGIWAKYADEIQFCCPVWETDRGLLVSPVQFKTIAPVELKEFNIKTSFDFLRSFYFVLCNLFLLYKAMRTADHIHLRCPGNVGLLACVIQILFPKTPKTAKYAGNWDPNSKQPWSYRLQKWILSNTFLTKNIKVLVYGEWKGSTENITPFFTATYKESDKKDSAVRKIKEPIRFLFVGTLSKGKRPLYALELISMLKGYGFQVCLDIYGEGFERDKLEEYITINNLSDCVVLHGNQSAIQIEEAYKTSHFMILPSQSEGWPKVVAEAMFWGCVPISTKVSCVPYMLGDGSRGVLLNEELKTDVNHIVTLINQPLIYEKMANEGMAWSREFTLDKFEMAIANFLKN